MTETAIVRQINGVAQSHEDLYDDEKIALIKRTFCKGASNDELELFMAACRRAGLDPFARQICAVFRKDRKLNRDVMTIQTTIDGYRLIASRSGKYQGQIGPQWCGPDGEWKEIWLETRPPAAARVGVLHADFKEPLWGKATWSSYAATYDGNPTGLWAKMPDVMIAKCAEGLALRKAFPQETLGIYTEEEMMQADNEEGPIIGAGTPPVALPRPRMARRASRQLAESAEVIETTATTEADDEASLLKQAQERARAAFRQVTSLPYAGNNGEAKRFGDYCRRTGGTDKKLSEMTAAELSSIADLIEAVPSVRDRVFIAAGTRGYEAVRSYVKSLGLELHEQEVLVAHPEWVQALALLQQPEADDQVQDAEIVDGEQQGGLFGEGE